TVAVLVPQSEKDKIKGLEGRLVAHLERALEDAKTRYSQAPATSGTGSRTDEEVVRVKLPSGARLLVKRDRTVGLVAMRAVWMGGLRYEDEKVNGINNLLAALVTRGTRTHTGDEIARDVEGMAGSIGGFSGRNSFGMRMELLSR